MQTAVGGYHIILYHHHSESHTIFRRHFSPHPLEQETMTSPHSFSKCVFKKEEIHVKCSYIKFNDVCSLSKNVAKNASRLYAHLCSRHRSCCHTTRKPQARTCTRVRVDPVRLSALSPCSHWHCWDSPQERTHILQRVPTCRVERTNQFLSSDIVHVTITILASTFTLYSRSQ